MTGSDLPGLDPHDPEQTARDAGLVYVAADEPGVSRRRRGRGFAYYGPSGELISGAERDRIEALVIPPAWTQVWISRDPDGHIQVTGRDEGGRKQYIYHAAFRAARDQLKYRRMRPFGHHLPLLRRRVGKDLRRDGIPFEKAAAAAVRMLDIAAIRVGNDQYAVANGSFGVTTLRSRHLEAGDRTVTFRFQAKGGKESEVEISDAALVDALRELNETPGYRIFKYVDTAGRKQELVSDDVNRYLAEVTGETFSAKDFRTWSGNARTVDGLMRERYPRSEDVRRERLRDVLAAVADFLGNTPPIARSSYVDPRLVSAYEEGEFPQIRRRASALEPRLKTPGLRKRERRLLAMLEVLERG